MKINKKRITAMLMTFAMLSWGVPVAYAGQQNSYHDPADNWLESANRTEELDVNSTVTKETFQCYSCDAKRLFTVMRTPEYTRDGQTAISRNVRYSDGTMTDGETKGSILDGTPNKDASYTGYHFTKAICDTCATINGNLATTDYGFNKNVYWLYDCAEDFMQELEQTVSYAYADDTYHTKTTNAVTALVIHRDCLQPLNFILRRYLLMRMSIKEKEVLYAFGCPTYHNTIARLKTLATLTVDPNAQTMIERLIAKLSEKGVEKWYRCFFYNLRLEMEGYHNAERVIFVERGG